MPRTGGSDSKVKLGKWMCRPSTLYVTVKDIISEKFFHFGVMVGTYPVWFSVVPLLVATALAFGLFRIKENTNTEQLFIPAGGDVFRDRSRIREVFPDTTAWNFDAFGLTHQPYIAELMFRVGGEDSWQWETEKYISANIASDHDTNNIFKKETMAQIRLFVEEVKRITVQYQGKAYGYSDICARSLGRCVVQGEYYTTPMFMDRLNKGEIQLFNTGPRDPPDSRDVTISLAGIKTANNGSVLAARVLKIQWYMQPSYREKAHIWNREFMKVVGRLGDNITDDIVLAYITSESLPTELLEGTKGDTMLFVLTLALVGIYSIFVSAGGDMVSTRAMLACGGVLSSILGIMSSMGLLCLCGVEIVSFVGIMPFLVMGIGVDDMFLLMSAYGESYQHKVTVPQRVGLTFAKAGIGISITTLTDFLAFLVGIYSPFLAVSRFCVFTATAVLFCYIINCLLFGACLSLHGDRVYASKHCFTWRATQSRQQYKDDGAGCCKVFWCGGKAPEEQYEDESPCERLPRYILPKLILHPVTKVMVLVGFIFYLSTAVYGTTQLKPGMRYSDLVLRSSHYYKYNAWDETYYRHRFPVSVVIDEEIDYGGEEGDHFRELMNSLLRDRFINETIIRCWLHQYSRSPFYPRSRAEALDKTIFMAGLHQYLQYDHLSNNDVIMDATNRTVVDWNKLPGMAVRVESLKGFNTVIASRCFVLTIDDPNIFRQSEMMIRLRNVAKKFDFFHAFVFSPIFLNLEHIAAIMPSTLQTVGSATAAMFVVTLMMLPQLLMVALVTLNIIFILTCVYGFMYFLDISFSGITMIHVLMSVGFSVDYSAHICAAYLMSEGRTREERSRYALVHASGPIFNGGMSSLVGVFLLLFSESYFFRTFFKIISMVITAGAINSVFFMPIVLSWIGPENQSCERRHRCIGDVPQLPPGTPSAEETNSSSATDIQQDKAKEAAPKDILYGDSGDSI